MFHADLTIETDLIIKKITNENQWDRFFNKENYFNCKIGDLILSVEYSKKGRSAMICWMNGYEETFYFINENKNGEYLSPLERLDCDNEKIIRDIVLYFCRTGQRHDKYSWIAEDDIY